MKKLDSELFKIFSDMTLRPRTLSSLGGILGIAIGSFLWSYTDKWIYFVVSIATGMAIGLLVNATLGKKWNLPTLICIENTIQRGLSFVCFLIAVISLIGFIIYIDIKFLLCVAFFGLLGILLLFIPRLKN